MDQLGPAWSYALHASSKWGSAAGAPLIAGGRVYFQDLQSNTYAFDLKTGDLIWRSLARQSAITTEISEIAGGAAALNNNN